MLRVQQLDRHKCLPGGGGGCGGRHWVLTVLHRFTRARPTLQQSWNCAHFCTGAAYALRGLAAQKVCVSHQDVLALQCDTAQRVRLSLAPGTASERAAVRTRPVKRTNRL
jgi:hypothetical protein